MKQVTPNEKLLGLNANEAKLWRALAGVPRRLYELEKHTRIPHATLIGVIERLEKRGLCRSVLLSGKRKGYVRVLPKLLGSQPEKDVPQQTARILKGKAELLTLIDSLLIKARGERLLSLHGPQVAPGWLSIFSRAEIKKRNELIIANNIIVERFVPEHGYRQLFQSFPKAWQQTMLGRAHITYFLPDKLFASKTEIIVLGNTALLYETDVLRITLFSHPETVKLFRSIFDMYRSIGKKIDSEREFLRYINDEG